MDKSQTGCTPNVYYEKGCIQFESYGTRTSRLAIIVAMASLFRWTVASAWRNTGSSSAASFYSSSASSLAIFSVSTLIATSSGTNKDEINTVEASDPSKATMLQSAIRANQQTSMLTSSGFLVPRLTFCDAATQLESAKPKLPSAKLQRKMTAIGHFAVASETAWNPSIITFAMQLQGAPLTKQEFQALWQQAEMPQRHPRFHQRLVPRRYGGWQFIDPNEAPEDNTKNLLQAHVTETVYPRNRWDLRSRLQRMQLDIWNYEDSLWYMAIASERQQATLTDSRTSAATESTPTMLLFRGHHALADGASMAAALADLFDEASQLRQLTAKSLTAWRHKERRKQSLLQRWWRAWTKFVRFVYGSLQSVVYQGTLWWHNYWDANPWKELQRLASQSTSSSNNSPVHRTLSWSEVAPVEQVKWVADVLGRGSDGAASTSITINDIFVSCVTAALARQLQYHRQRLLEINETTASSTSDKSKVKPLARNKCIHVAVPVHLKGGVILPGESVGNNIGAFVVRVPGEIDASETTSTKSLSVHGVSVDRLYAVNEELNFVKQTPTALLSHLLAKSLSFATSIFPVSWISKLYSASNAGSLVVVSNNRGAPMPVHLAGRRVESIYGFVPLPPGIPVGFTVTSYAGNICCTLTAEPWAVPDGDQFMVWVLEEYLRLVAAAKRKQ